MQEAVLRTKKKYKGLYPAVLAVHGVTLQSPNGAVGYRLVDCHGGKFLLNQITCHLCSVVVDQGPGGPAPNCGLCPIVKVTGKACEATDSVWKQAMNGNPKPLIDAMDEWLRREALKANNPLAAAYAGLHQPLGGLGDLGRQMQTMASQSLLEQQAAKAAAMAQSKDALPPDPGDEPSRQGFRLTGECRVPEVGEYYCSWKEVHQYKGVVDLTKNKYGGRRWIALPKDAKPTRSQLDAAGVIDGCDVHYRRLSCGDRYWVPDTGRISCAVRSGHRHRWIIEAPSKPISDSDLYALGYRYTDEYRRPNGGEHYVGTNNHTCKPDVWVAERNYGHVKCWIVKPVAVEDAYNVVRHHTHLGALVPVATNRNSRVKFASLTALVTRVDFAGFGYGPVGDDEYRSSHVCMWRNKRGTRYSSKAVDGFTRVRPDRVYLMMKGQPSK
jgi:hypothetical protein